MSHSSRWSFTSRHHQRDIRRSLEQLGYIENYRSQEQMRRRGFFIFLKLGVMDFFEVVKIRIKDFFRFIFTPFRWVGTKLAYMWELWFSFRHKEHTTHGTGAGGIPFNSDVSQYQKIHNAIQDMRMGLMKEKEALWMGKYMTDIPWKKFDMNEIYKPKTSYIQDLLPKIREDYSNYMTTDITKVQPISGTVMVDLINSIKEWEMDKLDKDIKALQESIDHWKKDVVDEGGIGHAGHENCPLCHMYYYKSAHFSTRAHKCEGCPIQQKTGKIACLGSPYHDWAECKSIGDATGALRHAFKMIGFMQDILVEKLSQKTNILNKKFEEEHAKYRATRVKYEVWVDVTKEYINKSGSMTWRVPLSPKEKYHITGRAHILTLWKRYEMTQEEIDLETSKGKDVHRMDPITGLEKK